MAHQDSEQDESWNDPLAELRRRREVSTSMGGTEKLSARRDANRLNARSRLDHLLDNGSFLELGTLAGGVGIPADAIVVGSGEIDGRPVMVAAEDFTVIGGTISSESSAKRFRVAELALADRVPLIMLLEGAGFRADGKPPVRAPLDLLAQARCSGKVPLVTAILGASAGHGALVAPISDFATMSATASVFTAGPPVVKASLGEDVTKDDLGGPTVAVGSGLIHNVGRTDEATLDLIRRYLTYFPSSAWSYPDRVDDGDVGPRQLPELLDIIPRSGRRGYDMRAVVESVFDAGSTFEIQPGYGEAIICSLARLGGHPVAVVSSQPNHMAGSIDAASAEKAARFILVADSFHLPLVFLADNPGMMPGVASERSGILRKGARMFWAQTTATSPKLHVVLRKAYGFGAMAMGIAPFDGQSAVVAYPGATLGAMGAAAMSSAGGSDAAAAAAMRSAEVDASFTAAESFTFDELIDPVETRSVLIRSLDRALHRRQAAPEPVSRVGIAP